MTLSTDNRRGTEAEKDLRGEVARVEQGGERDNRRRESFIYIDMIQTMTFTSVTPS